MTLSSWKSHICSRNPTATNRSGDGRFWVLVREKVFLALPGPLQEGFLVPGKVGLTLWKRNRPGSFNSLNLTEPRAPHC